MKKCLGIDRKINDGNPNIKIKFNEEQFLKAVELICNDIEKKYKDKKKKIGLIGLARGGLPLLVAVSHRIDIRNVNVVQIQMTNTNNKWDYGEAKWVNGYIDDEIDEFIIFEDMVSHGRSINLLINELEKRQKKVLAVYSLFMNEDMKNITLDNEYIDIMYVNLICQKQWVYFFWEKGYINKD